MWLFSISILRDFEFFFAHGDLRGTMEPRHFKIQKKCADSWMGVKWFTVEKIKQSRRNSLIFTHSCKFIFRFHADIFTHAIADIIYHLNQVFGISKIYFPKITQEINAYHAPRIRITHESHFMQSRRILLFSLIHAHKKGPITLHAETHESQISLE